VAAGRPVQRDIDGGEWWYGEEGAVVEKRLASDHGGQSSDAPAFEFLAQMAGKASVLFSASVG